jgi:hypothetical protein
MAKQTKSNELALLSLVGDITVFPVYRVSRVMASSKGYKENTHKKQGRFVFDAFCVAGFLALLYYLGAWNFFGNNMHGFWYIGGFVLFVLGVSYLIGALRRRRRKIKENGRSYYNDYESIKHTLMGMGYGRAEAVESADYVMSRYANEELDNKVLYAIKYFGAQGGDEKQNN